MEKYKDSDVELMSILLKLQEQTSPIRMSIGYTVGGTVRQGIILYEAAPKVIETLDILNPDKLKELVGEGVYNMKVKEDTKTTYKFDSKFEKALKAIFTGDYTFETTLEEFLDEMSIKPDDKQKKLLLKKLKGEFEKDKETLISVLVPEGEAAPDFDVELWYIYHIKNGELIKAFLPEEMLDATIEGIQCRGEVGTDLP